MALGGKLRPGAVRKGDGHTRGGDGDHPPLHTPDPVLLHQAEKGDPGEVHEVPAEDLAGQHIQHDHPLALHGQTGGALRAGHPSTDHHHLVADRAPAEIGIDHRDHRG